MFNVINLARFRIFINIIDKLPNPLQIVILTLIGKIRKGCQDFFAFVILE